MLALHGAGVDHREVMACLDSFFDAITGYRWMYPDLPGMGARLLRRRSEGRTLVHTDRGVHAQPGDANGQRHPEWAPLTIRVESDTLVAFGDGIEDDRLTLIVHARSLSVGDHARRSAD